MEPIRDVRWLIILALVVAYLAISIQPARADHNIYLPLVPGTPIIQHAFQQKPINYCLNDRASTYPSFASQVEDVTNRYRALGFIMNKAEWGSPFGITQRDSTGQVIPQTGCELQHNMENFNCGGCAARVFYANWPVVVEYRYLLGYTDWRSAIGHEVGHALLGLHEQYNDSTGIGCTGRSDTVMDCGFPHVRYPQPLDIQRFCALPGASVMAGCIPIRTLICQYSWDCDIAIEVFNCESSLNPLAVGGLGERGIAQIHPVHQNQFNWPNAYNPRVNLDYAERLYEERGWSPTWSCYDLLFPEEPECPAEGWDWCVNEWRWGRYSWAPWPEPYGVWKVDGVAVWDYCDPSWNGRHSPLGFWVHVGTQIFFEGPNVWFPAPAC